MIRRTRVGGDEGSDLQGYNFRPGAHNDENDVRSNQVKKSFPAPHILWHITLAAVLLGLVGGARRSAGQAGRPRPRVMRRARRRRVGLSVVLPLLQAWRQLAPTPAGAASGAARYLSSFKIQYSHYFGGATLTL